MADQRFVAVWCDVAKAEANARSRGWTPDLDDFSPLSYMHELLGTDRTDELTRTESRPFRTLSGAVLYLQREIFPEKSLHGDCSCSVEVRERVEGRCWHCHCTGWLPVRRYSVDCGKVCESEPLFSHNPLGCDYRRGG